MRNGFTLVEIIFSILLISIFIGTLLKMQSNNSELFSMIYKRNISSWNTSLLLGELDTIKENKKRIALFTFLPGLNKTDDDFRKYLVNKKLEIYKEELKFEEMGVKGFKITNYQIKENDYKTTLYRLGN